VDFHKIGETNRNQEYTYFILFLTQMKKEFHCKRNTKQSTSSPATSGLGRDRTGPGGPASSAAMPQAGEYTYDFYRNG